MSIKILLVDPSIDWLESAQSYFKENHYQCDIANTGKDAQLKIFNNKYFAVILNVDVQNHSGLQVMKYIKLNCPGLKVILTLSDDERIKSGSMGRDDAIKLGAQDLLASPFKNEDLKALLEGHQDVNQLLSSVPKREGVSQEEEVEADDNDFTKIKISEFFSSAAVLFDIYIRLNSGKYIKILHAGDTFSRERIDKYKNEKGVEYLYFKTSDRKKYIRFCNYMIEKMASKPIPVNNKVQLVKNAVEKYVEDLYVDGLKPIVIDQGKQICNNVYSMIEKEQDLFKLLRDYQDFDANAYSHAFLVMFFSSLMVNQFEWQSRVTTESIALACMFHDIGKLKLGPEFINLPRKDMTPTQIERYKEHPELGGQGGRWESFDYSIR